MAVGALLAGSLLASPDTQPSSTLSEIISGTWENLGENGYQTGTALLVATLVVVSLRNSGANAIVLVPVAIGAFWGGWLGWNTFTGEDNPLFPGDLETNNLLDVVTESPTVFLILAIGFAIFAAVVWKPKVGLATKIAVIISALLGASFIYNLILALDF